MSWGGAPFPHYLLRGLLIIVPCLGRISVEVFSSSEDEGSVGGQEAILGQVVALEQAQGFFFLVVFLKIRHWQEGIRCSIDFPLLQLDLRCKQAKQGDQHWLRLRRRSNQLLELLLSTFLE